MSWLCQLLHADRNFIPVLASDSDAEAPSPGEWNKGKGISYLDATTATDILHKAGELRDGMSTGRSRKFGNTVASFQLGRVAMLDLVVSEIRFRSHGTLWPKSLLHIPYEYSACIRFAFLNLLVCNPNLPRSVAR